MSILPHEGPDVQRLERMPVTVRRKVAETGARLDEDTWRRLPKLARQRLVDVEVDTSVERRAFRQLVGWLRSTFLGDREEAATESTIATTWRDDEPPVDLALAPGLWRSLSVDLRYALVVAKDDDERRRILGA